MKISRRTDFIITILVASITLAGCAAQPQPVAQAQATAAPSAQPTRRAAARSGDRIIAEGEIVPVHYTFLTFSTQGILEELLVNEGDMVQPGQVLGRLKGNARLQASIAAANVEVLAAQKAMDDLKRGANLARAQAQLQIAQTNKALKDAKEDRDSMAFKRANQSTIETSQAQLILAEDAFKRATDNFAAFEGKDANDVNRAAALTELAKARQERDRARANFNFVSERPDEFEIAIAEGKLVVAQAQYDKALADYELVKNGPDEQDLALAQARVDNANLQLNAAKAALTDLQLTAPFAGQIVTNDLKIGEVVGPQSTPILLADLSTFEVKSTDLTELSVINIQPGDTASITLDAIPDLELTGKVTRIKALGEDKQGDITYAVYVSLDKQDPRVRWNMTASITFQTD